jgi:hypothetical protein
VLGLCVRDMIPNAVGFRVDHVGILQIRCSIRLCGSGCCICLVDVFAVVPGRSALAVKMFWAAYFRSSFSSSSLSASSNRFPDLWML